MKNLTWQNPEQLFVAQVLINKVKSKCCGIKVINNCAISSFFVMMIVLFGEAESACERKGVSRLPLYCDHVLMVRSTLKEVGVLPLMVRE